MRLGFHPATETTLEIHAASGSRSVTLAEIGAFAAQPIPEKPAEMIALGQRLYQFLSGPMDWLAALSPHSTLEIDCSRTQAKIAHISWELLHDGADFLVRRGILPLRLMGRESAPPPIPAANRPLRLLFMACSPRDVRPVLDFELEERIIHDVTEKQPIHLISEEAGSVTELQNLVASYETGFFDVFHLTGHADHYRKHLEAYVAQGDPPRTPGQPVLLTENDAGRCYLATAEELSRAFGSRLPRAVFLSGCRTGELPDSAAAATAAQETATSLSLAHALLNFGFPAVLGWARPVFDFSASLAGSIFYGALGEGQSIEDALRNVYRELVQPKEDKPFVIPDWHLLRLFTPARLTAGLVTPKNTLDRALFKPLKIEEDFLDPVTKTEKVAGARRFVGRRRILQRCLPALEPESSHTGVVIWGMGGLGKSSVAARLCDRLQRKRPAYRRVVLQGILDPDRLRLAIEARYQRNAGALEALRYALPLQGRLENFFEAVKAAPLILVLDDFEQNARVDSASAAGFTLTAECKSTLAALAKAIRESGSPSRIIVTSRYFDQEAFPDSRLLLPVQMPQMDQTELRKKALREGAGSGLDDASLESALGNPRLFESLLASAATANPAELQERMRGALELGKQLAALTPAERHNLARLSVFQVPAGPALVNAVVAPGSADFRRAISLGAVERSEQALGTTVDQLRVTALFRPLLEGELPALEWTAAYAAAARATHAEWWVGSEGTPEEQILEIVRLARFGGERKIACDLLFRVVNFWNGRSRYRETLKWGRLVLQVFEDPRLLSEVAFAERNLGETGEAERHLARSLELEESGGEGTRARSLHEMAGLRAQQGDVAGALEFYRQSLEIRERIGHVQGQSTTLHEMAGLRAQQGDVAGAMELYGQSLEMNERIGDVQGQAAALHEMARLRAQRRDVEGAMELFRQSLEMEERIGDVRGQAATLHELAMLRAQQGDDVEGAMELFLKSLEIEERIGNVKGQATTLNAMAVLRWDKGDVEGAMELFRQSLEMKERIGDARGQAATLLNLAALAYERQDRRAALEFGGRSVKLMAQTQAYSDLVTGAANLAVIDPDRAQALLTQAVWLAATIRHPDLPILARGLFHKIPTGDPLEFPLAALSLLSAARMAPPPPSTGAPPAVADKEAASPAEQAQEMLGIAAGNRNMTQAGFDAWMQELARDPDAKYREALEQIENSAVPAGEWLFDPHEVKRNLASMRR